MDNRGLSRRRLMIAGGAVFALTGLEARAVPATVKQTLSVAFVVDLIPFVVNKDRGVFPDITREALRRLGYQMKAFAFPSRQFDFDPLSRFADLDLFVGTPVEHRADYHYAKIYEFSNVAVSLASSRLKIESVSDLSGKDIVAFNNAGPHLKQPFTALYERELKHSSLYHEVENHNSQFQMLLDKRTQLIILDRTMVRYYSAQAGIKAQAGLVVHEIFPLTNAVYVVGRDAALMSRIEIAVGDMMRDGTVRKILAPYE